MPLFRVFQVRIQSECWKIRTRKNSEYGHFSRSLLVRKSSIEKFEVFSVSLEYENKKQVRNKNVFKKIKIYFRPLTKDTLLYLWKTQYAVFKIRTQGVAIRINRMQIFSHCAVICICWNYWNQTVGLNKIEALVVFHFFLCVVKIPLNFYLFFRTYWHFNFPHIFLLFISSKQCFQILYIWWLICCLKYYP